MTDIENKRDDGSYIQNSDERQKEQDELLINLKNTDKYILNQSQNNYNDDSKDCFMGQDKIGKTIADEDVGKEKFEKSFKKNISDGPEENGLDGKNDEKQNLDYENLKDINNHLKDGPERQEKEPFNLERIIYKTTWNFIDSSINIFLKFLICIVISPFLMLVVMWLVSDGIIVALFGTISSVNYSRWQKIEDEAEKENLCCKGLCKTCCQILFCLWAAFNFIIAPIISALPILFYLFQFCFIQTFRNTKVMMEQFFKKNIDLQGRNLKKKRKVKSIVFLFEMRSISKINQLDNFVQEPNKSIEFIKLGLYTVCLFWILLMLILTPIITLYLIIFRPFLRVFMQLDQVSYLVIKTLFNDFEIFEDVQSFDEKKSGFFSEFCCLASLKKNKKTIQRENVQEINNLAKSNQVQDQKTQNISQYKEEEEKKIDYSQNRYHRKKLEIIKEQMEERKINYGDDFKDILQKVELEQTYYEKWLDQDMIHTEDKQEYDEVIKKQKMIRQQEMQEFWKSYQKESNKVKDAKNQMQNELSAWQKIRGVHYDQNELQIKVKELNDDFKASIEKWGTHYDRNDLKKKEKDIKQKKYDDLKALEKNRGIDYDPIDFDKKVQELD